MKNYKANINYFTKWEGLRTLGLGMLIVGFGSLWLARSYLMYIGGAALIVAGFAIFMAGNIGRSSESDIMSEVARRKEGIEFPEVENERDYQKRVPQRQEILDFEGFSLRQGLYLKKMKNGSICSSEYSKTRMFLLTDAFYIKSKTFSLVSEEERSDTCELPFTLVENIELESDRQTLTSGKKSFSVTVSHMVITYDGGKKLRLPGKDDAYADELVKRLKKMVANAKNG